MTLVNGITYTQFLLELVCIICEDNTCVPDELALTEDELRGYYHEGKTPTEVYFSIWERDAGNYYRI